MCAEYQNDEKQKPVVRVRGGLLEGFQENGVFKFYGVPYARPPVGKWRWRPPQPLEPWQGTRKADRFGPIAYQMRPPDPSGDERMMVQSEDCLYLNIWTPSITAVGKMPVMVWIHGGGYMVGSGSKGDCDGTVLAKNGVVLVSFNYRLGPLGNLALAGLEAESEYGSSGNYGILDQIAALQWIKNNISSFDGDGDNITIFGVSAGAMSVALLCSSPKARGLFSKAICESGGLLGPPRERPYQEALQDGLELQKVLGAAGVEEMRSIRPEKLMEAARVLAGKDEQPMKLRFAPALDDIIIKDQDKTLREKSRIPMIIGSNKDEATYFIPMMPPITLDNYAPFVHKSFGNKASRVLASFPAGTNEEALKNFIYLHTCNLFTMLVYELAGALSRLGGEVYVYRFNRLSPKNLANGIGASHGEEVPYIFGHVDTEGYTGEDRALSESMMKYWVQFCKTGNPNGTGLPHWPKFSTEFNTYLSLDEDISTKNYADDVWFQIL